MSHTTKRENAAMKDVGLLKKAVDRIPGAQFEGQKTVKFYSSTESGLAVKLPGYRFPVVIDPRTGEMKADTYGGNWGDEALQDKLQQGYAIEAGRADAEKKGALFAEEPLSDGSVKCTITLGGGTSLEGGSGGLAGGGPSL